MRINKPNMTRDVIAHMLQKSLRKQMREFNINATVEAEEGETFKFEMKTRETLADLLVFMSRMHHLTPEFTDETETGFMARFSYVETQ